MNLILKKIKLGSISLIANIEIENLMFERITNGDILIFNHKTNQYRLFRFMDRNENKIRFKHEDILLNITY